MSTSSSSRNEVVRLPAAMDPEQPRTRICMDEGFLVACPGEREAQC
jgi:hypothetical protein